MTCVNHVNVDYNPRADPVSRFLRQPWVTEDQYNQNTLIIRLRIKYFTIDYAFLVCSFAAIINHENVISTAWQFEKKQHQHKNTCQGRDESVADA